MTVAAIMTRDPMTVREDAAVGRAAELLLERRYILLPVVDVHGRYIGVFDIWDLLGLLLPKAATLGQLVPDLNFIADDLPGLRARLFEVSAKPVRPHARPDLPVLRPETSVSEATLLFYRNRSALPVVEEKKGHVVGVLSYWDLLGAVVGKRG